MNNTTDIIADILAKDWMRKKKYGKLADTQCTTVFKASGHRCEGIYMHDGACQDIDYKEQKTMMYNDKTGKQKGTL